MQHNNENGTSMNWLDRAMGDFRIAQRYEPGFYYEDLCFHCQQAVEKAIKSILIRNNIVFTKTHDVRLLLSLLPVIIPDPISNREAAVITDYAVSTRYPGEFEPLSENEWMEALDIAGKTLDWAKDIIVKQ